MNKKETTIDDLAQMVASGFNETQEIMNKRFEKVDKALEENKKDHRETQKRLNILEFEITELAHRAELDQLKTRVAFLEKKVGIT